MSEELLTEITTSREFRRFTRKNLGILELEKFEDGIEFKATNSEWYFIPNTLPEAQKWVLERFQPQTNTLANPDDEYANNLVYGADKTRNVVSVEVKDSEVYIYTEVDGEVSLEKRPFKHYFLTDTKPLANHIRLAGDLHFKYLMEFGTASEKQQAVGQLIGKYGREKYKQHLFNLYDAREEFMVRHGMTYFKGMSPSDVSILSFDIETNKTLDPTLPHSKTLLISNTLRKSGQVQRKLFALDEYKNELSMILAWCDWVREMDPSILTGHNIFGFDLYYLQRRLQITQKTQIEKKKVVMKGLPLGRDGSEMTISKAVSQFRKDGSQSYDYHKTQIFGREIIDGFFMSIRYDIGRDFPSYGLKPIVEHLGMEKAGRIKWDFEKDDPNEIYHDAVAPVCECGERSEDYECEFCHAREKWKQYKEYCIDDADDSLKLFDLMIGATFFATKNVPISFQTMYESASGKQLNLILIRGYLQKQHSIPRPSEKPPFQGAISLGMPGVYKNVFGLDFSRLYPSIIMQWEVFDKQKDPLGLFLEITRFFALERDKVKAEYEKLKAENGDEKEVNKVYNKQNSMKQIANSCYGLNGTPGLHFNSPPNASFITEKGRELFEQVLVWATGEGEQYWRDQL